MESVLKELFRKIQSNAFGVIHIFGSIFTKVFLLISSKGETLACHVKLGFQSFNKKLALKKILVKYI